MKKLLLFAAVCCACMAVTSTVRAESGKLGDNITWEYNDGTLTLSGTGEMEYGTPWSAYKDDIKTIVINSGITNIGWYAFYGLPVVSVSLPDGLKTIGNGAFKNCVNLKSIVIPNSVEAIDSDIEDGTFSGCTALESVTLPSNLKSIQGGTFQFCTSLKELVIPASVTYIGWSACWCSNLAKVTCLAATPPELFEPMDPGEDSFSKVPGALLLVPDGTVDAYKASLWAAYFAEIKVIGMDKPDETKEIDGVTYDRYGDKWQLIKAGDKAAETLDIPEKIDGKPVTDIKALAFSGNKSVRKVTVPASITILAPNAFKDAEGLETVILPEDMTGIGYNAFYNCTALKNVTLPEGLTAIGNYAFYGCKALTGITFPSTLERIYDYAFTGCTALKTVTCLATTPPSFYSELMEPEFFEVVKDAVLYVPTGCMDIYSDWMKSSWPDYFSDIREIAGSKEHVYQGVTYISSSDHWTVAKISDDAPSTLELLTEIGNLPVTVIGNKAMQFNESVKNLTVPSSITAIGTDAFDGSVLTYLTWNVKKISTSGLFKNCDKLYSVVIGPDVEEIPDYFCSGSSSLGNLTTTFATSLKKIGFSAFHATGLTDLDLGYCDGVEIDQYAFEQCEDLQTVFLEGKNGKKGVTKVGAYAFNRCDALWMLTLADNTESIGNYAFSQTVLESVILNGVKSIGKHGFSHIYGGLSVTIKGRVPEIDDETFQETPVKNVRLDCSIESSYKSNDKWTSVFASPEVKLLADELTDDMIAVLPDYAKDGGCGYIVKHHPDCEDTQWVLEANAPEGYTFLGWEDEPCNSKTITLPASVVKAGAVNVAVARFEKDDSFAVTVKTASSLGDIGGVTAYSCNGLTERPDARFNKDEQALFRATDAKGWAEFKEWKHNLIGEALAVFISGNEISFTVSTGGTVTPTEITAVYAYKEDVDVNISLDKTEGGEVQASVSSCKLGGILTLTAEAAAGYQFKQWEDLDGNVVSTDALAEIQLSHHGLRAVYTDNNDYNIYDAGSLRPFSDFATDYTFRQRYKAVFVKDTSTGTDNAGTETSARKTLHNGQLLIRMPDGREYDAQGKAVQ
jgi:hypothetical protein